MLYSWLYILKCGQIYFYISLRTYSFIFFISLYTRGQHKWRPADELYRLWIRNSFFKLLVFIFIIVQSFSYFSYFDFVLTILYSNKMAFLQKNINWWHHRSNRIYTPGGDRCKIIRPIIGGLPSNKKDTHEIFLQDLRWVGYKAR